MTDVFISYSHEDQEFVRKLVRALEGEGFSVWWDHTIPPGQTWESHIERHLQAAKACIVVWSPVSIASDWVKEEATTAQQAGKLLPIRTHDAVQAPMGFRRIQAGSFQNWRGERENNAWQLLVGEVRRLARDDGAPTPRQQSVPPPRPSAPRKQVPIALMGGVAATLAIVGVVGFLVLRPSGSEFPPPVIAGPIDEPDGYREVDKLRRERDEATNQQPVQDTGSRGQEWIVGDWRRVGNCGGANLIERFVEENGALRWYWQQEGTGRFEELSYEVEIINNGSEWRSFGVTFRRVGNQLVNSNSDACLYNRQ